MTSNVQAQSSDILIVGEMSGESASPLVFEMLGLARRLVAQGTGLASVLLLGQPGPSVTTELIAAGADRVYVAPNDSQDLYQSDVWLAAIRETLTALAPELVLAGHTSLGADLAPRLAFQLGSVVAMGCEAISRGEDGFLATRPCFGHKAMEVILLRAKPAVATIRSRTHDPLEPDPKRLGDVTTVSMGAFDTTSVPRVKSHKREGQGQGPSLEKAKVVVAGGRGLGGPEGFAELAKLAETLGGVVGASRVACDLGWCPPTWQIGLTGKTVAPTLYVAVGISGASHHMAGCGNSNAILAINSDPDAAIFKEASFGVVGDYKLIVPALINELAQFNRSNPSATAA